MSIHFASTPDNVTMLEFHIFSLYFVAIPALTLNGVPLQDRLTINEI